MRTCMATPALHAMHALHRMHYKYGVGLGPAVGVHGLAVVCRCVPGVSLDGCGLGGWTWGKLPAAGGVRGAACGGAWPFERSRFSW